MQKLIAPACFAALLLAAQPATAEIEGKARALAGDRLEVGGVAVQLFGVDTPERQQACARDGRRWDCGFEATAALAFRVASQWVSCLERGLAEDGVALAVCSLGGQGGPEVNSWVVAEGWAVAVAPIYGEFEAVAKAAARGIWQGDFVRPEAWRRGSRLAVEIPPADPTGSCVVKGSVTADGERLYHLPGGAFYPHTAIDPARGERWFCSEADAAAAGWRRSPH